MNGVEPVVRHMLLCEDVEHDPDQANRLNILGLVHTLQTASESVFPICCPQLTVFLLLSGGRGSGEVHVAGIYADSGENVFRIPARVVYYSNDPLAVQGLTFRILDVPLPQLGLYWIQFWYNDKVIAQEPLMVR